MKKRTLTPEHRAAIAKGMDSAKKNGWRPNWSAWPLGLAAITAEHREIATRKAAKTMRGRPQRIDAPTGAHTDNQFAKQWCFINKGRGLRLEGKNLNQLIRDHRTWFDPDDVMWKDSGCNAARGLRSLLRGKVLSWKGWTEA